MKSVINAAATLPHSCYAGAAQGVIAEALAQGGLGVELAAAEVYLALGDTAEATRHARPAYQEAWADGPPYALELELERARAGYKALGLPEPQLPPFDPAKVPPVPYEAEIRAFIEELQAEREQEEPEQGEDLAELADLAPQRQLLQPAEQAPLPPARLQDSEPRHALAQRKSRWWAPWTWGKK